VSQSVDVVVVGGGFYGASLAIHARLMGYDVALLEAGPEILGRSSFANQARLHNGYHYPRAFITAWRSHSNYDRFAREFRAAIVETEASLYAIARDHSLTNSAQFARFMKMVGAPLRPAPRDYRTLFSSRLIEDVFMVDECVFDASVLRVTMERRLEQHGVDVRLNTAAIEITPSAASGDHTIVTASDGSDLACRCVLNCTYSHLNHVGLGTAASGLPLKHEVAELALVEVPDVFDRVGVTVMDGPFFSLMPFPARGLHSLTHVRYTPHANWVDSPTSPVAPSAVLAPQPESRFDVMRRDAARYIPSLADCRYVESLFEVKTVPVSREDDDGRPIVVHDLRPTTPAMSILGGKVDNIYDVLPRVDQFLREVLA